ncbi:hypothetical protein BDB00DRAFT_876199 [Zychaea mexicana]|uniref:uncharacterized protein n=1 Tax=Zychaea mexicana TaxID=64656 RepID=UPI0022FF0165|nr:uncharacterized protein BDB00DRAFT_876199 [Zychaea mexicana]KAI9489650.1 hypothetical protein BDB00DRAFT_876199 [Zychaea mexicana]
MPGSYHRSVVLGPAFHSAEKPDLLSHFVSYRRPPQATTRLAPRALPWPPLGGHNRQGCESCNKVGRFLQAIVSSHWQLVPAFIRLLEPTTPGILPPPAYDALVLPTLASGEAIDTLTTKTFRRLQILDVSSETDWYPRTCPAHWRRFWQAQVPHKVHIILWRAHHQQLSTRARLHSLCPVPSLHPPAFFAMVWIPIDISCGPARTKRLLG